MGRSDYSTNTSYMIKHPRFNLLKVPFDNLYIIYIVTHSKILFYI